MDERPFSSVYDAAGPSLTLSGVVDDTAGFLLRRELTELTGDTTQPLLIDLTDVDFLPSSAIGVLATAQRDARAKGGDIAFRAAEGTLAQRVLSICGLDHQVA